ncbi:hypothetical protein J3F84DRAFT_370854 [Trichoderma pleuroticola]
MSGAMLLACQTTACSTPSWFNVAAGRLSRGFNVPRDARPNQQPPGMLEIQHWPVIHDCDPRPSCDSSPVCKLLLHRDASIVSCHVVSSVLTLSRLCNVPMPCHAVPCIHAETSRQH